MLRPRRISSRSLVSLMLQFSRKRVFSGLNAFLVSRLRKPRNILHVHPHHQRPNCPRTIRRRQTSRHQEATREPALRPGRV